MTTMFRALPARWHATWTDQRPRSLREAEATP